MNANVDIVAAALERARQLAATGRGEEALPEYNRVLAAQPEHAEALAFLGAREMALGRPQTAIEYLQRAAQSSPDEAQILLSLGSAYLAARQLDVACTTLARCLELAPDAYVARLQYGIALEQSGNAQAALPNFFGAIMQAQTQGRWLSDASTSVTRLARVRPSRVTSISAAGTPAVIASMSWVMSCLPWLWLSAR